MAENVNCHTGLDPNIISEEVFNRELALCRQLNKDGNGRCGWGNCDSCGVIPLLYKLHKGELLEDPNVISETKENIFNQK